jgi:hypothetical protein
LLENDRVRLVFLVILLAGVIVVRFEGVFEPGGEATAEPTCPSVAVPLVTPAGPEELAGFRADLERTIAGWAAGRPAKSKPLVYEQGVVSGAAAWTDMEPGTGGVPASRSPYGGFEMRWWIWTWGWNDVVADVFRFEDASAAAEYMELAADTECRRNTMEKAASLPPGARYLEWSNPFNFAQQDVFLRRGSRVYRVSVVQPGAERKASKARRELGFRLVGEIACGLPMSGCARGGDAALGAV